MSSLTHYLLEHDSDQALGFGMLRYVSSSAITWPNLELGNNCLICE